MASVKQYFRTYLTASAFLVAAAFPVFAAEPVVVSSKIDTEGAVLGQVILQSLERAGVPVTNRLQLGGTSIVRNAIKAGEIDIYPEYTGNAAFFHDQAESPVWNNAVKAYATASELDLKAHRIVWLTPADANNTWAMSVRSDLAQEQGLATLDDLAEYINNGGAFKFAGSAEFVESPSALPAFQEAYGFKLKPSQLLVLSGGNTAATMRAAALDNNDVNGAMTYGTDGGLSALGLKVLTDPKGVQPVYQPAPIIREEVLAAYPQIREILKPVFQVLDLETLQRLNGAVAVQGMPAETVVRDFLDTMAGG